VLLLAVVFVSAAEPPSNDAAPALNENNRQPLETGSLGSERTVFTSQTERGRGASEARVDDGDDAIDALRTSQNKSGWCRKPGVGSRVIERSDPGSKQATEESSQSHLNRSTIAIQRPVRGKARLHTASRRVAIDVQRGGRVERPAVHGAAARDAVQDRRFARHLNRRKKLSVSQSAIQRIGRVRGSSRPQHKQRSKR
jgi:hypothetical protein